MKTVLCYGDSNTWGYNPVFPSGGYPYEKRWTTVLQRELGSGYLVIPEGQNGRTTVWEDPIEGHKNGAAYLPACLASHKPLDWVVIMLGTNDLKQRFSLPACDIAAGVGVLTDIVYKSESGVDGAPPEILVLIPPEVRQLSDFDSMFAGSREKSLQFPAEFQKMREMKPYGSKIRLLDAGKHVRFSNADGVHFEESQLEILGRLVARAIVEQE
ncbi:MAG: hydrolase [Spirochaetales bacterium]|nr:MAG: hydrolase [Spirochaetales bacterium]